MSEEFKPVTLDVKRWGRTIKVSTELAQDIESGKIINDYYNRYMALVVLGSDRTPEQQAEYEAYEARFKAWADEERAEDLAYAKSLIQAGDVETVAALISTARDA
jgi:squalene cyclase